MCVDNIGMSIVFTQIFVISLGLSFLVISLNVTRQMFKSEETGFNSAVVFYLNSISFDPIYSAMIFHIKTESIVYRRNCTNA